METEPTEEVTLNLPWNLICEVACLAMCMKVTFDEAVQRLMLKYANQIRTENT